MPQSFALSFANFKGVVLSLIVLLLVAFAYHKLLQSSIRSHPEAVQRAVREHCRYIVGKQINQLEAENYAEKFQACDSFTIKSVEAAGGLHDPVIVRITLAGESNFPLGEKVFIFKAAVINFHVLNGWSGLVSGRWEFNFYNNYSDFTFNGSI
jgi:hypothetical protein